MKQADVFQQWFINRRRSCLNKVFAKTITAQGYCHVVKTAVPKLNTLFLDILVCTLVQPKQY